MTGLISTNPARNSEPIGEVEISSAQEIENKVKKAQTAKFGWKELGLTKRVDLLRPIGQEFKSRAEELAQLISREMGKPIRESRAEAHGVGNSFEWNLNAAPLALQEEITFKNEKVINKIHYEPLGVAAVITPWNFPLSTALTGILPNLIAGNTVVFKTSEECPMVGQKIAEIFNNHQLPEGVFSEIYGAGAEGKILSESALDLIFFTGSSQVGQKLYQTAAAKFIKAVLEMGGSNPCLVFESAEIDKVVPTAWNCRFENCGQVCDAVKRLIVHESLFDEVVSKLTELTKTKRVGDPLDENTDLGPLVAKRQLDLLQKQVAGSVAQGAQVLTGGKSPENLTGAFYEPTILTNISPDMPVWKEEVFGPVLPIISFKTEEEAVKLANDTPYGLGSRVFSSDQAQCLRVASQLLTGSVEINNGNRWSSDSNPFGGYKLSGLGRAYGQIGLQELCQIKLISAEK